jgi:basic amino acid/polyamine antiporter, APA family
MFGDAILVPITEVGSLAVGVGWLSACAACILRERQEAPPLFAYAGAVVALAIVLMKVIPQVPGSFTRAEWTAFIAWSAAGLLFWLLRRRSGRAARGGPGATTPGSVRRAPAR